MRFALRSPDELANAIRLRAIEIAAGTGETIDPPPPVIQHLREPVGFGIHGALADYQDSRGLTYIQVAAAEAAAQWDLVPE